MDRAIAHLRVKFVAEPRIAYASNKFTIPPHDSIAELKLALGIVEPH